MNSEPEISEGLQIFIGILFFGAILFLVIRSSDDSSNYDYDIQRIENCGPGGTSC